MYFTPHNLVQQVGKYRFFKDFSCILYTGINKLSLSILNSTNQCIGKIVVIPPVRFYHVAVKYSNEFLI